MSRTRDWLAKAKAHPERDIPRGWHRQPGDGGAGGLDEDLGGPRASGAAGRGEPGRSWRQATRIESSVRMFSRNSQAVLETGSKEGSMKSHVRPAAPPRASDVCRPFPTDARAARGNRLQLVGSLASARSHRGMTTQSDATNPVAFVGVTPCRVVDTRTANGTFGGPILAAATPRSFPIPTGPCAGIPGNAQAYSLNVTVTGTLGAGFILIYPQGGVQPLVSTLNYGTGQTVANAAIVPAGTAGGITVVAGAHGTHLIIDINGYYGDTPDNASPRLPVVQQLEQLRDVPAQRLADLLGKVRALRGRRIGGRRLRDVPTPTSPSASRANRPRRGYGVVGISSGGVGVQGTSNASGINVAGVWGTSTDAIGTYGFSTQHQRGLGAKRQFRRAGGLRRP